MEQKVFPLNVRPGLSSFLEDSNQCFLLEEAMTKTTVRMMLTVLVSSSALWCSFPVTSSELCMYGVH